MEIKNYIKEEPKLFAFFVIISLLIIVKFGIIVYFLLLFERYIWYLFKLEWDKNFNPKNPYRKLGKWLRGCFSLGNDVWLDTSLGSEFSALNHFCKTKKGKVTIYTEQIEAIAAQYNNNPSDSDAHKAALEAINRIETFQKGKILKILPPVPAAAAKVEPIKEVVEDCDTCVTNVNLSVNVPQPPKPVPAKIKYLNALKHYAKQCTTAYVSKDPELRIRVRQIMEQNKDIKIEIVALKDFKSACEYINRFKVEIKPIKELQNISKAKKAKINDRKVEIQEFLSALSSMARVR